MSVKPGTPIGDYHKADPMAPTNITRTNCMKPEPRRTVERRRKKKEDEDASDNGTEE